MAVGKNTATAVAERPLNRERPQSMCPEVQPLAIFVPHPINAPTADVAIAVLGLNCTMG